MDTNTNYYKIFSVFRHFKDAEIIKVTNSAVSRKATKNELIYEENDPSDFVYFIKKGKVKIGYAKGDKIKTIMNVGDAFGVLGLIGETQRAHYAQALEKSEFLAIKTTELIKFFQENPALHAKVLTDLCKKLVDSEKIFQAMLSSPAEDRIIHFLARMMDDARGEDSQEVSIALTLTHQDIAGITSTSRQTVTRVLNDLKKKSILSFNRSTLVVHKPEELLKA